MRRSRRGIYAKSWGEFADCSAFNPDAAAYTLRSEPPDCTQNGTRYSEGIEPPQRKGRSGENFEDGATIMGSTARVLVSLLGTALVLVLTIGAAPAADEQVDISKLKPGQKVEVKLLGQDWQPGEVLEAINDNIARVKCRAFPNGMLADTGSLRLPKKAGKPANAGKPSKSRSADDPFATPEEQAAGGQRTWSDRTGKFKVDATIVRVDDDKVVLRRDDDKEITIPRAKLSDADQKFLADFKGGKGRASEEPSSDAADEPAGKTEEPTIPLEPTDLTTASQVTIAADAPWTYKPEPSATRAPLKPVDIVLLPPADIFEQPLRLLLVPSQKKAFAVFAWHSPGMRQTTYRVQECDLAKSKVVGKGDFGTSIAPFAISDDGSLLLARSEGTGFGTHGELRLYRRDGAKAEPLVAWMPYRHHESPHRALAGGRNQPPPDRPALGIEADVTWAEFLDEGHVITLNQPGELAVWTLPKVGPVYVAHLELGFAEPAFSPRRQYLAVPTKHGVAILQAATGEVAGVLDCDMTGFNGHRVAWSDDGTRLALVQDGRIRVWDLATRELTRDFPGAAQIMQSCCWSGNKHLVVNGLAIDVDRRIPVSHIPRAGADSEVLDGAVWQINRQSLQPRLTATPIFPKGFKDPAEGQTAEQLLAIKPGMEVAIEMPQGTTPDFANAREEVVNQLTRNGMKIVPQSKLKLAGTMAPGETKTVKYQTFRRDQVADVKVVEQVLTLNYTLDDQILWKHVNTLTAPTFVSMEKGETIQDAIARATKPDPKALSRVWIPAYIARTPEQVIKGLATGVPSPGTSRGRPRP